MDLHPVLHLVLHSLRFIFFFTLPHIYGLKFGLWPIFHTWSHTYSYTRSNTWSYTWYHTWILIWSQSYSHNQCRLIAWTHWAISRGLNEHRVPCYSMYVVYSMFLMFIHWLLEVPIRYMFTFIEIYSFIPVSCVGMYPIAVLCLGPIMLLIRHCSPPCLS